MGGKPVVLGCSSIWKQDSRQWAEDSEFSESWKILRSQLTGIDREDSSVAVLINLCPGLWGHDNLYLQTYFSHHIHATLTSCSALSYTELPSLSTTYTRCFLSFRLLPGRLFSLTPFFYLTNSYSSLRCPPWLFQEAFLHLLWLG